MFLMLLMILKIPTRRKAFDRVSFVINKLKDQNKIYTELFSRLLLHIN